MMHFHESLLVLPFTYLTTDHGASRPEVLRPPGPEFTRERFGFTKDDIILACFNQLYKIEPEIFAVWMRVMKRVPRTKLWLLKFDPDAEINLRKEARRHGVDPSRLVVHDFFPLQWEFIVKSMAAVFLDTPVFNAHTTASDVLWAGLPILAIPGNNFAQRVSSSFLRSTQLELLNARTLADYEEIAVHLATHPAVIKRLKRHLRRVRLEATVFHTDKWVPVWERALRLTWEVKQLGMPPTHIVVNDWVQ